MSRDAKNIAGAYAMLLRAKNKMQDQLICGSSDDRTVSADRGG